MTTAVQKLSLNELYALVNSGRKSKYDSCMDTTIQEWLETNAHVPDCEIVGYGMCTCGWWITNAADRIKKEVKTK